MWVPMSAFRNNIVIVSSDEVFGFGAILNGDGSIAAITGATIRYVTVAPTQVDNAGSLALRSDGTLYSTAGGGVWFAIGGGGATGWQLPDDVAGTWGTNAPGQVTSTYVSASNRFDLVSDAVTGAFASPAFRFRTGTSTAALAAPGGGTGEIEISSGNSTATANGATAGATGSMKFGSGDTDTTNAGATGASSGVVEVYSGSALSTAGGASGSSANVTVRSGNSADANSGSILLSIGTAAGTQGTIQGIGRMTTTDGVAAGTARVIGGRAFSSTAASATITGGAGAQTYSVSYSIPANTLKAGSIVNLTASVKALTQNAGDTFTAFLRVGGQVVASCASFDINANDFGNMRATLNVFGAPGAAVQTIAQGQGGWTTAAAPYGNTGLDVNLATNGALTVDVQITYGSASAGNTSNLSSLAVFIT